MKFYIRVTRGYAPINPVTGKSLPGTAKFENVPVMAIEAPSLKEAEDKARTYITVAINEIETKGLMAYTEIVKGVARTSWKQLYMAKGSKTGNEIPAVQFWNIFVAHACRTCKGTGTGVGQYSHLPCKTCGGSKDEQAIHAFDGSTVCLNGAPASEVPSLEEKPKPAVRRRGKKASEVAPVESVA